MARPKSAVALAFSVFLGIIGLVLLAGGGELLLLAGSPYYLAAGVATVATAALVFRTDPRGALLYGGFLLATIAWSLWEVGFDGWQLAPRLVGPAVIGLAFALPPLHAIGRRQSWLAIGAGMLAVLTVAGAALRPGPDAVTDATLPVTPVASSVPAGDWPAFGRGDGGTRFSPLTQIDATNVKDLQPAWTYHTGVVQQGTKSSLEVTPIMTDGRLFLCTQTNVVIALDPETGRELWRFDPQVDPAGASTVRACRAVTYYAVPDAPDCRQRVITATFDARLIALDADTGRPCRSFGVNGAVDLKQGMGAVLPGFYYASSAPVIARGRIVLGGWVADNASNDEPSGVIRAFDAKTGAFAWAWDAGDPSNAHGPKPGRWYTRSTPNSWAPMSVDDALGLVYVPTGNATPDHFGGGRIPASEKFSSSVVALDAGTGTVRWSFQTAHHDLWDYDVPAQPTLVDWPMPGGAVPAVVQATKRGLIFVLDRRTGTPLVPVEERAAPQRGAAPGEHLAKTQPYPVDFPAFDGGRLAERDMWGLTPIDQLWCRIRFRQLRYDGPTTPPGLDEALIYPSIGGGMNWGGISVDPTRGVIVVNTLYYGTIIQLLKRAEVDRLTASASHAHDFTLPVPMAGTPYGARLTGLVSPLDTPCNAPPFGRLAAIDMRSHKLLWSRPVGTARDSGPLGLSTHLPLPMGLPGFGGTLTTGSGLVFMGAVREHAFRAFSTETGKELWYARLPAGGQANPMTYLGPRSGRQFVVIAAGGHVNLQSFPLSDTIVAYALPRH